jgi:hypothetical protein
MPIRALSNDKDADDIHVVMGHATTELWNNHAVVTSSTGQADWVEEYQNHHNDVQFRFLPNFRGTVTGHVHSGFGAPPAPNQPPPPGIRVNLVTGQVLVDAKLANPHPNNFILTLVAKHQPTGPELRYLFRIHVHEAYERIWLTPDKFSIRRRNATGGEDLGCRFSVRALFTDGVVGDVTNNPEVQWGPPAVNGTNVEDDGKLRFSASDGVGKDITIRASISYNPTSLFDDAILHVDQPWSAAPPLVAELVPGSFRMPADDLAIELPSDAVLPANRVPNVLFIGDGFTDAEAPALRSFVIDLAHTVRQDPISFPWNRLRGSMNFWMLHVPASQYGVSIGARVISAFQDAGLFVRVLPPPESPPVQGGDIRGLGQLIHEVGLPLPGDILRTENEILQEWINLLGQDPSARLGPVPGDAIDAIGIWQLLTTHGLVDEVDSPLGTQCGRLSLREPHFFDLSPRRGGRARMDSLLRVIVAELPDAAGVVARRPIGHLWAQRADGTRPPDYDLVCIVAPSTGRVINGDGYFLVNMFAQGEFKIVHARLPAPGNRYEIDPPEPLDRDAEDHLRGSVLTHELSHSFNLGDEYAEHAGAPGFTLDEFANLQKESDAQRGPPAARVLHGDEIRWRWHRIERVGVVSAPLTLAGNVLTVKLRELEALFFGKDDRVHLRQRNGRSPLGKFPKLSVQMVVDSVDATGNLVLIRPTGVAITYPNLVQLADAIATFGIGSILYKPKPASAAVFHATDYPYAEMIGHNIKAFITRNRVPLVAFPPAATTGIAAGEQIPVFVPDTNPAGVQLAPTLAAADRVRIVGLYPGGATHHLGVFHPTGHCMMRSDKNPVQEFCAVCRYLLVETIDPSLHDVVDLEYDRFYPQT